MKSEVKYKICKITDLLKDYVVLHERIKALYTILEVHGYIHWYWLKSNHAKKKNYWENYYDIVKNTITIDIKTFDPIKRKEDYETKVCIDWYDEYDGINHYTSDQAKKEAAYFQKNHPNWIVQIKEISFNKK